ncbi:MAG: hypothetical protein AAB874_07575 [Patescibacteria group bacterium]
MAKDFTPIRATTQEFVEVEDIKDNLVLLADGSCVMIVETTAVNFGLLSEKEQEALIYAYSGLLNSLSFPIQVYLRSKHKDISAYLGLLEVAENKQTNPVLANRIARYRAFIASTVKERNVLDKKFYIVIPFSALELGPSNVSTLMGKRGLPYPKNYVFDRAKTVLGPKRDHILRQLNRLGLKGTQLSTQKLVELFHDVYNHGVPFQPTDIPGMTTPLVNKQPW